MLRQRQEPQFSRFSRSHPLAFVANLSTICETEFNQTAFRFTAYGDSLDLQHPDDGAAAVD